MMTLLGCAGAEVGGGSGGPGSLGGSGGTQGTATDASGGGTTSDGSGEAESSTSALGSDSGDSGPCNETVWYLDADGDGRGTATTTVMACDPPAGYVPFGDDCDDASAARYPGATELCDGADDDCDGLVDEASTMNAECNGCALFEADGRAYAFCAAGATWDGARVACAAFAGDLLRFDDAAESASVIAFAEPPPVPAGGWFIGLSDSASEGAFVWIDGAGLDFTSWNAGEPNDAGGVEDCVEIDPTVGIWNDVPCDTPRAFVCESPAP